MNGNTLTAPVYAFSLQTVSTGGTFFFMVYLDGSQLNEMLIQEFFGPGYSSCALAALGGTSTSTNTVQEVTGLAVGAGTGTDVSANGAETWKKSHIYTSVIFEATGLLIGSAQIKSSTANRAVPLSAADHQKALDAFKAQSAAISPH